jgi:D-sedoheptulose 7-phosphate isomerase
MPLPFFLSSLMNIEHTIRSHFTQSLETHNAAQAALLGPLTRAISVLVHSLQSGGKIMACGNGGSAADAQHFAAELVNRFEQERPPLAALALTTDSSTLTSIGNDYHFDDVFAKQVRALGRPADALLAISTSGHSANVVAAVSDAQRLAIPVIALTGRDGGKIGQLLGDRDIHLCVPAHRTARIQEIHLLMIHCLCDGIDQLLYAEGTSS